MALPDDVRGACARVAARARSVRLREEAVPAYADSIQLTEPARAADRAFVLQLNAINFGSGWFPTLRKLPGMSGFRTIESRLRARGAFSRDELLSMSDEVIAGALGQDPGHELMALYAAALRELGERVDSTFDGWDAVAIAEALATFPTWRDVSIYDSFDVPFFKRAQIAAAELAASGVERLTMFADNLVPHVLRLDGVLEFDTDLVARIDRGELLQHGSPEEVEIRACAVHAVELLAVASGSSAAGIDFALWNRGGAPRYKAHPRHRARCTAY